MNRPYGWSLAAALCLGPLSAGAAAQELSNDAFRVGYDSSGIRSLKRTNDVHDTDYIAANGVLGRLFVRYRTTVNGHWRELRDMLLTASPNGGQSIGYTLGTLPPSLAARSSPSAAVGAGGLRALNDGHGPLGPDPSGRGRG
ncbi:MAG TPA: hypothetical protein VLD67_01295, partial [Vicinamibacterales bacterium]|nr:hypothetical protein [Vicinamibacterales bacterium]